MIDKAFTEHYNLIDAAVIVNVVVGFNRVDRSFPSSPSIFTIGASVGSTFHTAHLAPRSATAFRIVSMIRRRMR
jgi:hypothetical protein